MKITGFQGIKPRTSPRLIDGASAQVASNTNLSSGEVRPLSLPAFAYLPHPTTRPGPHLTIYRANALWFSWPKDVDVCLSPLQNPAKWVYTGDGEPRITTEALASAGGGDNYPAEARALGVPKPQTRPTVAPTGGVLTDVDRFYVYSFYDDWNQESAFSPVSLRATGKPDGTWAISGMDSAPPNSGGIVNVTYSGTTVTVTTSTVHFNRAGEAIVLSGVTTVTGVNGTWTLTATTPTTLVFTATATPTGTYNNTTDTADTWARKAPWGTCTKRIYRTTGSRAQFQLVATDITTSTFSDTLSDLDIPGDEAISASWELPPVDLKGVLLLPSGSIAGFVGNEICLSEPFQPHAWPPEYRMRSGHGIVALGLFTSGLVAGTVGVPHVIIGHEPGQMASQPVTGAYPCLSKRSMVSMGDSVGYSTAHGFARIGDTGVSLLTQDWFTRDDWDDYLPSSMIAETVRGRLYIMTRGTTPKMLIFDYLDGTGLTTADVDAVEIFADAISGKLYLATTEQNDIREFDPNDGVYMNQDWMSKEFVESTPINLGAARVNFTSRWTQSQYDALLTAYQNALASNATLLATGDVEGELNRNEINAMGINQSLIAEVVSPDLEAPGVTFTLYVGGVQIFTKVVLTTSGFTLPSGYKSDTFAFRIQGQGLVKSIEVAETMTGLRNA